MILHVDMDAFYASVEERDRPELRGQPVIVGGSSKGRGVVAAANYVVRRFGVHSAMPTKTALSLCPHAVIVRPRLDHYSTISRQIRDIFHRHTPLVEPLSLDEAFLDISGSRALTGIDDPLASAIHTAEAIKREIRSELDLVASVGVAPNKFLAKIASDLEKPDALVVVDPADVAGFLQPLPIGRLWGVGRVTDDRMKRLGVETFGDLRTLSEATLREHFGKQGGKFYRLSRGVDERAVTPDREAKSISNETTFHDDIADREVLRAWLSELAEHVGRRTRHHDRRGRTVDLKVRFSDFRTITRSRTLRKPTDITHEIWRTGCDLLKDALTVSPRPVRLLGIGLSRFEVSPVVQRFLFDDDPEQSAERERRSRLDRVADSIRERFGGTALNRGSRMAHNVRHRPEPKPEG